MKNKLTPIILAILMFLSIEILFITRWSIANFEFSSFDQILFTLNNSVTNASKSVIDSFINDCVITPGLIFMAATFFFIFLFYISKNNTTSICLKIKKMKIKFNVIYFIKKSLIILNIVLFSLSLYLFITNFYIIDFIKGNFQKSTFFEENYINPEIVDVHFSDEKKNLIYIYLESMESTYADIENGGFYNKNYIPELVNLAKGNISFSNTSKTGGANVVANSNWTIAALISQTGGVPLKSISNGNFEYENYEIFMPGVYSLGEILNDNGYKNYIMFGSDTTFGGRRKYFEQHGNYQIFDYYTAIEDNIISEDYYVFWGYEDAILFEYAKEKLTEISKQDGPFNFTLLTVDTHIPDGYTSDFCENFDDNVYLNAIKCSSKQVYNFVKWIQQQDFYNDTVIIISGDHKSMNTYSFENITNNNRRTYNAFINTNIISDCTTNREFTTMDMYPTTLAALGATIEGERLGLGTNLFSCEPTLSEQYGTDYINTELLKFSTYYVECITNGNCDK